MPATHFQQMIAAIPAVTPTAQSRKHHSEKPVRYAGPFELFGLEHLITACVGARDVFKHCLDFTSIDARIAVGVRLSPEVHERLKEIAIEEGRSVSNLVQRALEEWLRGRK